VSRVVEIVDTTTRDGNQSLWSATGLTTADVVAIAPTSMNPPMAVRMPRNSSRKPLMRAQRDPSSRAARRLQRDRRGNQSLTLRRASLSLRSRGPLEQQQRVDDCASLGFERSCGRGRVAVFGESLRHRK